MDSFPLKCTVITRKSASLKLAIPVWREVFNERLPQMSASLKKGAHLKNSI